MDTNNSNKNNLRSKAEAKVNKMPDLLKDISMEKAKRLLHELEVHQVELEMQNEELRVTQHYLEIARDEYTDLFDFAPVGYLILDEKGIIDNINLTGCNLLGIERSLIKGKPLSAYISPGESRKLFLELKQAFQTGVFSTFELELLPKNKTSFTALLQGTISKDKTLDKSFCWITMQDVTELRKAEALKKKHEDLQQEKENIEQYVNLAPVVFLLLDTDKNVQMINQKGSNLLGYSKQEILGKNWLESFITKIDFNSVKKINPDKKIEDLFLMPYFESEVICKNGDYKLMAWTNTSLTNVFGEIIGTLIAGEEITERKKTEITKQQYTEELEAIVKERTKRLSDALENEKQINAIKSTFVSIASHELRTPITVVMSSATLIEKYISLGQYDKLDPYIQRIKASIKNLNVILEDFLSIDKLERGILDANKEKFQIVELIETVINEMELMSKNGQRINYQHQGDHEITMNKQILHNILVNLISNAIKYSKVGIDLQTEVDSNFITIRVKDYGIGIPEKDQKFLFMRFFRAQNVDNIQGTGLGLSIVKRYLELLGGTIEFSSKVNEGSTFTIKLPNEQRAG